MPMSIEEIEVETLHECLLDEQRCANYYFLEVVDEHTIEECSPSTIPIEVIEESNHVVIPSTQCDTCPYGTHSPSCYKSMRAS
jgi:hypothetical protein